MVLFIFKDLVGFGEDVGVNGRRCWMIEEIMGLGRIV